MKISELFARFAVCWGQKWTSRFDSDVAEKKNALTSLAMNEWKNALCDLDDQDILDAYLIMRDTKTFPPSISEFREQALGICHESAAYNLAYAGDEKYRKLLPEKCWHDDTERDLKIKFHAAYDRYKTKKLTRCESFFINEQNKLANKSNKRAISHEVL